MSRRGILSAGALGFVVLGASLLSFAHVQNKQNEQSRLEVWSASNTLEPADVVRGELVARAGGCIACHTDTQNDGAILAGGVKLESSFGTFISPNISSDPLEGIGTWSLEILAEALLNGRRPDGSHYGPAFPYPAYAAMTAQDIADLHAWLQSSVPVSSAAPEHELLLPDVTRVGLGVWKALYVPSHYKPGVFADRGEYLVKGPAHCAECHAQRDFSGGVSNRQLSGNSRGPKGSRVPAISGEALQDWTTDDLAFFLEIGMTPEGDSTGGHMTAVIEHGTAHLPLEDLEAMAAYLKSPSNESSR
ncbi:MAG: mono/diheme cytochrome c family protein [bacterium]|jgi:mono/diheme cytochrome c family protein